MRKIHLRFIALIIAFTLLLPTVAFASMDASAYIAATSAWIERDGNTVEVDFFIVGTDTMDKIGLKYVYLYEKNGNSWSLVKTFAYTNPLYEETMMGSSKAVHAAYLTYSGSANKQYYADCRFYAEKDGGYDTHQQYTPISIP